MKIANDIPSGRVVKLGTGGITAFERYAPKVGNSYDESTYRWVERWTAYGEALGVLRKAVDQGEDATESLGNPDLLIHTHLIESERPTIRERGEWLRAQLLEALDEVHSRADLLIGNHENADKALEAIGTWHAYVTKRNSVAAFATTFGLDQGSDQARDNVRRRMADRAWEKGLLDGASFPVAAAEGIRQITLGLDRRLRYLFQPHVAYLHDARDDLFHLLPGAPEFEAKFSVNSERLKLHRTKVAKEGYTDTGIDDAGRTELFRKATQVLAGRIAQRKSMLVLGPTSSGKSHIAMLAAAHAVQRGAHSNCIVLLPTKALVNQVVSDWEKLIDDTEYKDWTILAGSRDYPHHDDALRRGNFQIAVMIPEKLLGLMANGMSLDRCNLIVADELQTIIDEQRGLKLQRLLSGIRTNHPQIPIMGISASLHAETKAEIVEWLRVDPEGLIEATSRPVPLQVSAFDVDSIKTREADSSQKEAEKRAHGLRTEIASWSKDPAVRAVAYTNTIEEYGTPLALALRLVLEENGINLDGPDAKNSQVLFFARTRDDAENLASLTQPIIRGHMMERNRFLKSGGGPYDGLFSSRSTAEEIEKQTQTYLRLPNTAMKQKVMASLRTGVGFHNARLEPAMRELMEDGFRAGFIRLLFATETLKLGINLPADAVIIGSMVTPEGDGQRLMSIDSGIQKMGRAGRLGYGSKGESFLFVPNKFRDDVKIDDKTLHGLALEVGAAHASERARALAAASDLDAVYRYYLSTGRWLDQGAHYTSHLAQAESWVSEHLLQDKFTRNKSYSKDEYVERIQELYKGTLDFRFTQALPDAERVFTSLIDAELLGDTQDEPGKYRLTGLGRAVSVNGVPTADAAIIKEMAVALEEGAGSLTMLWLAVTSSFVRDANSWIQVRRWDLAEQVQRDLNAQAKAVAREVSKLKDLTLRAGETVDDVIGEGRAADELRALLMGNGNPLSRYNTEDPHTDLLRAALLVPWAQGVSFHRINEGIANDKLTVHYVQSGERTRRNFPLHEADLRALAENVAYLLSAATDLLTIRPSGTAYRRLQNLAQAVEIGLPSGLHELARLNLPGTHRERLVPLVDHLDEHVDDQNSGFVRRT